MTSCWPWRTQSTQPYMHTESELALGQLDLLNARCVKQDPDQVIAKASSLPAFKRFDAVSCFHAVPCDLVTFDSLLLGPDAFICSRKRAQKQGSLLAESAEGCQSCDKTGFGMFSKKTQHTHTHTHTHTFCIILLSSSLFISILKFDCPLSIKSRNIQPVVSVHAGWWAQLTCLKPGVPVFSVSNVQHECIYTILH